MNENKKGFGHQQFSGSTGYQVLTDATGDPLPELYELLEETAHDITTAVPSPSLWAKVITFLLANMEETTQSSTPTESALDNICRLITRRLRLGNWS
jgi:hypothetical protein